MDSIRAAACSNGKGGDKRRDLYWQGKRIMKGSKEYIEILQRAKQQMNK